MKAKRVGALLLGAVVCLSGSLAVADETPVTYDFWLDAGADMHPQNPKLDSVLDGDSVTVHVDPTRVFPLSSTKVSELGFVADKVPPEARGFYVTGPSSGTSRPVMMQSGLCVVDAGAILVQTGKSQSDAAAANLKKLQDGNAPQAQIDAAQTAAKAAGDAFTKLSDAQTKLASGKDVELTPAGDLPNIPASGEQLACSAVDSWSLDDSNARTYVCGVDNKTNKTLQDRIAAQPNWSLIQKTSKGFTCLRSWRMATGVAVSGATADVTVGANAPQSAAFSSQNGQWTSTFVVKRDTTIKITVTYAGGSQLSRTIPLKVSARDTHSLVRLQGELLATNRLRTVSFAVALTPVRRAFFTEGPGIDCILLCAVTPTVLLRLSGDTQALVQLGAGLGLNLSQAFQMNAGVLFGTTDINTGWRFDTNWFVGISVDPLILSEAWTTNSTIAPPKKD
jgi:hypothetical protein